MTPVSSFLLFAFYTIVSLVRAAQLRRLQQTRIEFVQLNSARLPSYPSESVDDECPIFVLCSRGTSRSITPSLTTCISESAGSVASGVWTYPTTPDLVDPFLISLFPGETIQCRFSIRISEFVIFYQFQDEDEACTFSYEDLEQNQIQTCGLVGGGYFSLSFRQRTQDDNSDDNNSLDFKSLSPVVQTIVVAVIIFFSTLAVAIFCIVFYSRNNVRSRRAIFQVDGTAIREQGGGSPGSSPTILQAGTPQSGISSRENEQGHVVFLNPSSFTNPKQWFTNRLFMLGEPETYSDISTPTRNQQNQEIEMQHIT